MARILSDKPDNVADQSTIHYLRRISQKKWLNNYLLSLIAILCLCTNSTLTTPRTSGTCTESIHTGPRLTQILIQFPLKRKCNQALVQIPYGCGHRTSSSQLSIKTAKSLKLIALEPCGSPSYKSATDCTATYNSPSSGVSSAR